MFKMKGLDMGFVMGDWTTDIVKQYLGLNYIPYVMVRRQLIGSAKELFFPQ